jgi:hypothetical protein
MLNLFVKKLAKVLEYTDVFLIRLGRKEEGAKAPHRACRKLDVLSGSHSITLRNSA